ncbi:hypothetical protein COCOBI_12-5630 [Coccomyxa sp. Obi]|nr:hypothetical protein COCOBI_12-5630 [Coccomyxa sp. Obi]
MPIPSSSATEYIYRPLSAICACKQLRTLILRPLLDGMGLPCESSLSQHFMASLPELRVLLFQTVNGTEDALSNVFRGEIIAEAAAKIDPGLQLLLIDIIDTANNFALPESLCFLFLGNRYNLDDRQPYQSLGSLCNLEELYLLGVPGCYFADRQSDAILLQSLEKLRVAVVDIDGTYPFDPVGTIMLPSLELLALPGRIPYCPTTIYGTCVHTPVKCPNLKEVIFKCHYKEDVSLLEHLLSEAAPKLETIQVAVDYESYGDHLFLDLWRALARSSSFRNLKIILQNCEEQEFDQQVQLALQGALVEDIRLPSLEKLELYSHQSDDRGGPSFQLGNPLAHQHGASGVCMEIGNLFAVGALP